MSILVNSSWINPQIDFLLWIQNIRLHVGTGLDLFFLKATMFGEFFLSTLLISVIYWCIDSRAGVYLFSLNSISLMFSQLFKMMACVYRPWILNDKIKPVEAAMRFASGYSFPSGHSAIASSALGGTAFVYRKKIWLCITLIILILFVGISRIYLGVHTPQDVITGILTGFVLIFIIDKIINWCEKDKNRYIYFLIGANIFALGCLTFILLKQYPTDYVNGKLLVNPQRAIYKSIISYGWTMGLLNGVMLLRRFFDFDAKKGSIATKCIRGLGGFTCLGIYLYILDEFIFPKAHNYIITFIIPLIGGLFITAIYPYIATKIEQKFAKK